MKVQPLGNAPVAGFLHEPDGKPLAGLVLTHGAGANCGSALLVNLATTLASRGWAVLRYDLPFRQKRRFGPPSPGQATADQAGLRAAVAEMQSRIEGKVFLGGHSYGGRQASMVAAKHHSNVPGLLLLSYPLHPPNKPEQLRTAHFPDIHSPCYFIHGAVDPFGSPEEMRTAVAHITAPAELLVFDRLGHDLGKGKADVVSRIAEEFNRFCVERT
jgi:predicted alpha/beta-hydrolase family hydrolase